MSVKGLRSLGVPPHRIAPDVRKLLFVYPYCGLGGVETSTLTKIEALRYLRIEASVLFATFYGDGGRAFARDARVTVGLPDEQAIVELFHQGFDALSVIDYPGFLDLLDRNGVQMPVLFETHCAVPSALAGFYRYLHDPRILAIIVPSHHNERLVRERVNPRCDIIVVPNAVNTLTFRPGRPSSRSMLPELTNNEKLVLWVGRLEAEKNPDELIDIAERLLQQTTGVRFLIVGDHPGQYDEWKSRLESKIRVSMSTAFTFVKTISYELMPDLYRVVRDSGGVLLSTSLHESLPMTLLEAMASGCPVVSTDVGGVRDIIADKFTGRLYAAGDIDAAATILQELLSSENRLRVDRMTQRARREMINYHSLSVVASHYGRLLDLILGRGGNATKDHTAPHC